MLLEIIAELEPYYPKVGPQGGRRPSPIAVMLRIYCLQQWYCLSDPGAEQALYDIQSMRAFCHLELFQMAEVAIARQMWQGILPLIAELRLQPPPATA